VRTTLNDELMHEAGFEVASYEARERRRRRLRRVAAVLALTVACAIVAGIEFVRANARLGAASVVAIVVGVLWFLRAVLSADDEEAKS
jgi:heme A synthase